MEFSQKETIKNIKEYIQNNYEPSGKTRWQIIKFKLYNWFLFGRHASKLYKNSNLDIKDIKIKVNN